MNVQFLQIVGPASSNRQTYACKRLLQRKWEFRRKYESSKNTFKIKKRGGFEKTQRVKKALRAFFTLFERQNSPNML